MKLSENWYVDAPWAQLVCSTKIPDDKIKKDEEEFYERHGSIMSHCLKTSRASIDLKMIN